MDDDGNMAQRPLDAVRSATPTKSMTIIYPYNIGAGSPGKTAKSPKGNK
jgi:hypothetical protein